MTDWLVEFMRNRGSDRAKARDYIAQESESSFRETMKDYDAFVPYMESVSEPAILIGTTKDSMGRNVPVRMSLDEIHCHWLIQGGTGTGKTSFVTCVLSRALGERYPMGVVDCKSGFFDSAIRWAASLAYRKEPVEQEKFIRSLAVVNPFSDALVPLNVCCPIPGISPEVQAYEMTLALSRLFDSSLSFQMENILHHLLLLLIEAELSLVEAPEILQDELLRGILANRSRNGAVSGFFLRTYPEIPEVSKNALISRLHALLLPENLRLMLGADSCLDFKGILDRGDPLIMFLGKGPGVPEEQTEIMASLLLQFLFQAVFAGGGAGKDRRPYQIIMDEFFHLLEAPALERRFETALTTLRSFGVTLSLVMHNFSQIPASLRETILGNCDLMAIFRTSSSNAHFFGDFLPESDPEIVQKSLSKYGKTPAKQEIRSLLLERLQRLPDRHCYWYDKRKPHRALLLKVPNLSTPHAAAGISEKTLDEFITTSGVFLGGYALPKDVLRRQIEAREKRLRETIRPPIHVSRTPESQSEDSDNNGLRGKKRKPRLG